ncbi:MAG: sugar phosphate isomerase/epimerase [Deltaproteobacteria bacterium]|nr:sugar phosphate isomerase/epimerase [Deltaproteobacteria bacterium]
MNGKKTKRVQVHVPYYILLERFDELLGLGINPEVFIDGGALDEAEPGDLRRIRDSFGAKGLGITMHGPFMNINPGSADESVRLSTVARYERVFEVAKDLMPVNVVLHAGYHPKRFHGDSELWLDQSLKTWPPFVKEAERLGVVIAAENIFEKSPSTLKTLVEAINSPNLRLCLDSGHLTAFAKGEMEEWVKELGPYLAEVHLHDNNGEADDHLPLGEGTIDFKRLFRLLKAYSHDPVYTIEPHGEGAIEKGIEAIRKYLD